MTKKKTKTRKKKEQLAGFNDTLNSLLTQCVMGTLGKAKDPMTAKQIKGKIGVLIAGHLPFQWGAYETAPSLSLVYRSLTLLSRSKEVAVQRTHPKTYALTKSGMGAAERFGELGPEYLNALCSVIRL